MKGQRVFVTGVGAITPLGDLEETWDGVLAGKSRVVPVTLPGIPGPAWGAPASSFQLEDHVRDVRLRRELGRAAGLGVVAAERAWADAGLDGAVDGESVAGVFATPVPDWQYEALNPALRAARTNAGGEGFAVGPFAQEMRRTVPPHWRMAQVPNVLGYAVSARLRIRGPQVAVCTACASGADALGLAARMVADGRAEVVLAGAADCMLLGPVYVFLDRFRLLVVPGSDGSVACRPFDRGRSGLVPGEGAGFLVLESERSARRRAARVYGEVLGYGAAVEPPTLLEGSSSTGFRAAMESALGDAGHRAEDVAQVCAYGAGTLWADREEARAIAATFGARLPVTSTKGALGYLGAASGVVDAILALRGIEEGVVPPTARHVETDPLCPIHCVARREWPLAGTVTICNSHGLGGQYASLVLGGPS